MMRADSGLGKYGLTVFSGGRGPRRFRAAVDLARRAEAVGFGAVWTGELYSRSATVPMATIGAATRRIAVGSNIAYGVGRSPLIWAAEARDLDELTGGRLVLGLGNGTPGMMRNWLDADPADPAARMEELVTVLRKLWRLHDGPIHHEGRFYRVHLDPTAASPAPIQERLPIWTAAVGPRMARTAARVADGLVCHPMATTTYLDAVIRPALARGFADAGRSASGFVVKGTRICSVDTDVEAARRRIAYAVGQYAASRTFDGLFALHGWDGAQRRIRAAARDGDPSRMAAAVPDEAIDAIGIACHPAELSARAAQHAAEFDHLDLCGPPWGLEPEELEASTDRILSAMSASVPVAGVRRAKDRMKETALEPEPTTFRLDRPRVGVVVLTLDRPDRLNAMTAAMFAELEATASSLDREDALRVVVITGAGRAFCAGYDLADAEKLPELGALGMLDLQERAARALSAVRRIRVPVIAAVNGVAAGGGLALALAADIRLAAPQARFNAAFVRIGLSAGDLGTSWLLPRLIGPAAAAEFAYTGGEMDADDAERTGLVNKVVPEDELLAATLAMADQICANSPGGVWLSKRALHANMEASSFAAALELENRGQALLTRTADMAEALEAFRAGRSPQFEGR